MVLLVGETVTWDTMVSEASICMKPVAATIIPVVTTNKPSWIQSSEESGPAVARIDAQVTNHALCALIHHDARDQRVITKNVSKQTENPKGDARGK